LYDVALGVFNEFVHYRARRETILEFHLAALEALTDDNRVREAEELRANCVKRVADDMVGMSFVEVDFVLKQSGKYDESRQPEVVAFNSQSAKDRIASMMIVKNMDAVVKASAPVARELEVRGPDFTRLGNYEEGHKETLLENLKMANGDHYNVWLIKKRVSTHQGGTRDTSISAFLRQWSR
jgi:hypothetical protein